MACSPEVMEREGAFVVALAEATRYEVDGSSLMLLDDQGVVARLVAAEPPDLAS